jgi:hypothetical protein
MKDSTVKDACYAYLLTLPESEWGQMRDACQRIFGHAPPTGDRFPDTGYWSTHTVEWQQVFRAFLTLKDEGKAVYHGHRGWRAG